MDMADLHGDPNRWEGESVPEQQITVVFDVTAESREQAANALAYTIGYNSSITPIGWTNKHGTVESWWFPEGDIKHIDGNDNDDMVLVPRDVALGIVDCWEEGDGKGLENTVTSLRKYLPTT